MQTPTLALVALTAVCLLAVVLFPSGGPASPSQKPTVAARVAKLERRVKLLEQRVEALRVLVCLQVPTC